MRRAKLQPVRNKIDLSDPVQIRAWTRRLCITPDDLKRIVGKVGNSIAAVSKQIDLGKAPEPLRPHVPVQLDPASVPAAETVMAEVRLTAPGS
jgi:Protein of unknown function (DUF3606)